MNLDCAAITVGFLRTALEDAVGAGWLLPDGRIVTCEHVIADAKKGKYLPNDRFLVRLHTAEMQDVRSYRLIAVAPLRPENPAGMRLYDDLALLEPVDETQRLQTNLTLISDAEIGMDIHAVGYPERLRRGTDGYGRVGDRQSIQRFVVVSDASANLRLEGGFSGAPVASANTVVGLFAADNETAGRGYIITPQVLDIWLASQQLKPLRPLPPSTQSDAVLTALYGEGRPPTDWFDVRARWGTKGEPPDPQAKFYDPGDLSPRDLANLAIDRRRTIMLRGDGGSGKSNYLLKIADILEKSGKPYIWLDLKKLTSDRDQLGVALSRSDTAWIFEHSYVDTWDKSPRGWTILADGLNEVVGKPQLLLDVLDGYARGEGKCSLVVSKRTSSSIVPTQTGYEQYAISPLPRDLIRDRVERRWPKAPPLSDDMLEVLSSPQLLLMYVSGDGKETPSRPGLFERHFGRHNLESKIDLLSAVAFGLLKQQGGALSFTEGVWLDQIGKSYQAADSELTRAGASKKAKRLLDRLKNIGIVLGKQGMLEFQHSLFIEWLAARWLISQPRGAWTNAAFTCLSIHNSSEDGLRLAVEMLTESNAAGARKAIADFLNQMYDWSWTRVLAIVADPKLDMELDFRDAIIGLNALRFFDRFSHTRNAAHRDLDTYLSGEGSFCEAMKLSRGTAQDERAMMADLLKHFEARGPDAMPKWQDLLRVALGNQAAQNASILRYLTSPDPFLAWSASNFVRAIGPAAAVVDQVIAAYHASVSTALSKPREANDSNRSLMELGVGLRWRLLHAISHKMPAEAVDAVVEFMLGVWKDPDEHRDVRFGASRCLIELALDVPRRRNGVFDAVQGEIELWCKEPKVEPDWRRDTRRAAEQFWRGCALADTNGIDKVNEWRRWMLDIVELSSKAAPLLKWDNPKDIDEGLKQLYGDLNLPLPARLK